MLIENKTAESLVDLLEERKWKEFLEAIPADGERHHFSLKDSGDSQIIRVRAAQLQSDGDETYKVSYKRKFQALIVKKCKKQDSQEKTESA